MPTLVPAPAPAIFTPLQQLRLRMPLSKTFQLTVGLYTCVLDTNYSVSGYIATLLIKRLLRPLPLLKLKSPSNSHLPAVMSRPVSHLSAEPAPTITVATMSAPLQLTSAQKSLSPQLRIPATLGMDSSDSTGEPTARLSVQPVQSQLQRYKVMFLRTSNMLSALPQWAPSEPTRARSMQEGPRVFPGALCQPRPISAISRVTERPSESNSAPVITKPCPLPPPLPLRSPVRD